MRERERRKASSDGVQPADWRQECVAALWLLFVSGRFRANWCERHSRGLPHESTRSRGVGASAQAVVARLAVPNSLLSFHTSTEEPHACSRLCSRTAAEYPPPASAVGWTYSNSYSGHGRPLFN